MGAVYQAWDSELDVVVALKVIRPEASSDPSEVAAIERRFKQELLLARQVTHKNVVRIHDLGEIDGIKYITMSFHPGRRSRNRAAARRQAAGARGAAHHAAAGVGAGRGARGGRRASRPEARQHHDRRRPRHHHGFRHRAIVGRRAAAVSRTERSRRACARPGTRPRPMVGQHRRHHRLHGARAGQGRAGRSARGHVFARADCVRHADRPAAAQQRPQRDRGAAAPHLAAAAGAAYGGPADSGGVRSDRLAPARARPGGAVSDHRGTRRRARSPRRQRRAAAVDTAPDAAAGRRHRRDLYRRCWPARFS